MICKICHKLTNKVEYILNNPQNNKFLIYIFIFLHWQFILYIYIYIPWTVHEWKQQQMIKAGTL